MTKRQALAKLQDACMLVSAVLDSGKRDPTWHETQELENSALVYGRLLRKERGLS